MKWHDILFLLALAAGAVKLLLAVIKEALNKDHGPIEAYRHHDN